MCRNLALALVAALLAACGWHSSDGGAAGQTAAKAVAKKPTRPIDELSRSMVSAVASNKPSALPVQVKFELRDRPDVGQPLEVDLAIVPMSASVDRVSGKVEGEDGLELVEGGEIPVADRPAEGVPIRHLVKVLPKREGIYSVHAVVTVEASGVSSSESYSMPVIAAAAPTAASASSGVPTPSRVSEARPGTPATAAAQ